MTEMWIFFAFGFLQIVFHNAHKITGWAWVKKVSDNHWVVWLAHPVITHTVTDYVVHFVIYSGQIIGVH